MYIVDRCGDGGVSSCVWYVIAIHASNCLDIHVFSTLMNSET